MILRDLGPGEAVLSEVVNGGVDPPLPSLEPRPAHRLRRPPLRCAPL